MKKNIAIVAGGDSSEDVISFQSAKQIHKWIDKELYNVYTIHVKGTEWKLYSEPHKGLKINKDDFSITLNDKKIKFDCALIAIHGTPGENGILQAYFELLDIPYTTSGVLSSALSFNKFTCKTYLKNFHILSAKTILLKKNEKIEPERIVDLLSPPYFVKPNQGGSSFGISKINTPDKLIEAVNQAFKEDDEVLIEEFIDGIEITCGIVKVNDKEIIFPLTEIVSKNEFFDYEAKYTPGMADEITPARISKKLAEKCRKLSSLIYNKLNCRGIVRIDYILNNNKFYFLEINSVPGMTENSLVPKQMRVMGLSIKELFTQIIENAINQDRS